MSHAADTGSLLNTKLLLPVLITLHLIAAAALTICGLGLEEQESGRSDRSWQVVEWNPACVAGHANGEFSRNWTSEYQKLNATGADRRSCVNIH